MARCESHLLNRQLEWPIKESLGMKLPRRGKLWFYATFSFNDGIWRSAFRRWGVDLLRLGLSHDPMEEKEHEIGQRLHLGIFPTFPKYLQLAKYNWKETDNFPFQGFLNTEITAYNMLHLKKKISIKTPRRIYQNLIRKTLPWLTCAHVPIPCPKGLTCLDLPRDNPQNLHRVGKRTMEDEGPHRKTWR